MANMFNRINKSRSLFLSLIILFLLTMIVSSLIPQEINSTPEMIAEWRGAHHSLIWLVDIANLHRIYAQLWFVVIVFLVAILLIFSSYTQFKIARKKLLFSSDYGGEAVADVVLENSFKNTAQSFRYQFVSGDADNRLKFVKHPIGYFGMPLLHTGIAIVVFASLFVALTGRQGVLVLVEGVSHEANQPWTVTENGLLATQLMLPGSIRLDRLRIVFDEKMQPSRVSSDITVKNDTGQTDSLTASVNSSLWYKGMRFYHSSQYGDAFTVNFIEKSGLKHVEKILIQQPMNLTTAGYSEDFSVPWSHYIFSAKFYADADQQSMTSDKPLLFLRLSNSQKELERVSLLPGASATLGEYNIQLGKVEKWSKLIIVDYKGMPVVFAGFAIIMIGGLIYYMMPPRELIAVRKPDSTYTVYWRAILFRDFYLEERDEIIATLNKELK